MRKCSGDLGQRSTSGGQLKVSLLEDHNQDPESQDTEEYDIPTAWIKLEQLARPYPILCQVCVMQFSSADADVPQVQVISTALVCQVCLPIVKLARPYPILCQVCVTQFPSADADVPQVQVFSTALVCQVCLPIV